jgi:hypothetical protein
MRLAHDQQVGVTLWASGLLTYHPLNFPFVLTEQFYGASIHMTSTLLSPCSLQYIGCASLLYGHSPCMS